MMYLLLNDDQEYSIETRIFVDFVHLIAHSATFAIDSTTTAKKWVQIGKSVFFARSFLRLVALELRAAALVSVV